MYRDRGYEKSAHLYDLFDDKDNIDFFFHYAAQVDTILDIGAGTGRIALPLAERGCRVVCVEPSPAMRRQFELKLVEREGLRSCITLVKGDAASFDLGREFPAAFLSGSFDHFLTSTEREASLRNITRHLEAGGTLVFDVFLGMMKDSPLSRAGRVTVGDREYRRYVGVRVLPERQTEVSLVFEICTDGVPCERVEQRSRAGLTDRGEIHSLLAGTGFNVQREFSDYVFTPYEESQSLLVIEAIRTA